MTEVANRTMFVASRGISPRYRHLMLGLHRVVGRGVVEPKIGRDSLSSMQEMCELEDCSTAVYFECHKSQYCYLYIVDIEAAVTMKFQVYNVHTLEELRLQGNCAYGSKASWVLMFDSNFEESSEPHMKATRRLLEKVFECPNEVSESSFVDQVLCFFYLDNRIWFRVYEVKGDLQQLKSVLAGLESSGQLAATKDSDASKALMEVGPRFVLEPVHMTQGVVTGPMVWRNEKFQNPAEILRREKAEKMQKLKRKKLRALTASGEGEKDAQESEAEESGLEFSDDE